MKEERLQYLYPILYRALFVVLLFGICLTGFGRQLGIQSVDIKDIFTGMLLLGILMGINYCQLRGKIMFLSAGLVGCVIGMAVAESGQTGAFAWNYLMWFVSGSKWEADWVAGYEMVQSCLIICGCYLFEILTEKLPRIKETSAILLFVNLMICMYQKKEYTQIAVVLIFLYIVLVFVEGTQRRWKKKSRGNEKAYLLRILPFCMIFFVLMCFSPAPKEPYDWKFVKEIYNEIKEKFTIWIQDKNRGDKEDFTVAQMGFSEDGKLLGGIVGDDKELLTVQGSQGLMTNVYLTGKVYDTFDGREWKQTVTEDADAYLMDTLETLYAIEKYNGELVNDYVYRTGLSVKYEYFNTGYLFAPLKLQSIDGCAYQSNGANLIFGEKKGYGTKYKAVYYQLNIDHPEFYKMAETQVSDNEMIWKKVISDYAPKEKKNISLEMLQTYRSRIRETYGYEVKLSEDMSAYLAKITEDAKTTVQKLQKIEQALSTLTYSHNPGIIPEKVQSQEEFLDYFVLENKEGYCSYFATAFVLMARAEGIPARYVEGFCIPLTSNKNMKVTASMAHAWPEVYLEGVGWIPFEPTPGYEDVRYTPWKVKSEKNTYISLPEEEMSEEEIERENEIEEKQAKEKTEMWKKPVLFIVIILLGSITFLAVDKLLFKRRYEKLSLERRFLVEVRRNIWLLDMLGYKRKEEETLEELQARIRQEQREFSLEFLNLYEMYLYGDGYVKENYLQVIEAERNQLLGIIKQTHKWYYCFILLRFSFMR